jgi:hypothetical protein
MVIHMRLLAPLRAPTALVALVIIFLLTAGCTAGWKTREGGDPGSNGGNVGVPSESATPEPAKIYVVPMGQLAQAAIQPKDVEIFKDFSLSDMAWTSWTEAQAIGTGIGSQNLCDPSCADANYTSGPVRVVLTKPAGKCGSVFYTEITTTWTAEPPPDQPKEYTSEIILPIC